MKSKKEGFATIECIVSMTIICLGVYLVSNALYNSYAFTNYNKVRFEMLNTANEKIEQTKYDIKNEKYVDKYKEYKGYKIETLIEKNEYYQCYKININVYNEKTNVNLQSYVLKQ